MGSAGYRGRIDYLGHKFSGSGDFRQIKRSIRVCILNNDSRLMIWMASILLTMDKIRDCFYPRECRSYSEKGCCIGY